jgi:hypothetical protein
VCQSALSIDPLSASISSMLTDSKLSKHAQSALFDSERWQIFFYPNSGNEQFCSLYLSCEPTTEEREKGISERGNVTNSATDNGGADSGAVNGKGHYNAKESKDVSSKPPWNREGKFKFSFEVSRSSDLKSIPTNEAIFATGLRRDLWIKECCSRRWRRVIIVSRIQHVIGATKISGNDPMLGTIIPLLDWPTLS